MAASASRRRFIISASIIGVLVVVIAAAVIIPRVSQGTTSSAAMCVLPAATLPSNTADLKTGFIYQVMLDRFFNSDTSNDNPPGDQGLNDPTHSNWKLYWGGDLKGLAEKIPYIAGMGASAIWISPPVENVTTPLDYGDGNGPQAGYHGYWATDDYRIDPHLGTWADFDALVGAAHQHGLKLLVDFAANHSNPRELGQFGALSKDGTIQAAYNNDPNGWFHHTPSVADYNDQYALEYQSLFDLADLAQENPAVDAYLKGAVAQFVAHGVDGFRFDAVKHMPGPTGGWLRTLADSIEAAGPHYLTGEWQTTDPTDLTYPGAVRFANNSGISLLNFPVYNAIDDAYGKSALTGPAEIDSVLQTEGKDFTWLNDQPNFIDNHDFPRFLSVNGSHDAMHAALAVAMTIPGIPIVYYGTEQYLHNDTLGGGDPYNRPMMTSFDTSTPAYQLLHCLGALRASNPALAYGTYQALHLSHALYIYQRQFGQNVVVVAVNDSNDPVTVKPGQSALPPGAYHDYLNGKLHGVTLHVSAGGATPAFTLPGNAISVWQYLAPTPQSPTIGSVGPELAHPGETMLVDGQSFAAGDTVQIGNYVAQVTASTAGTLTATVPAMPGGSYAVTVCRSGACGVGYSITIASAPQVPVNVTVTALPALAVGDHVYLTGALPELGGGNVDSAHAIGPMISASNQDTSRFLLVSLPACQTAMFRFEIAHLDGSMTSEGTVHTLHIPCQGEGAASFGWQKP